MPERLVPSHDAVRRLIHFAARDGVTFLDLTYGAGGCWRAPLPPGIVLTTNDLAPHLSTDLHLNYRNTGLPARAFHWVVVDPPHTGDNGKTGIFWRQYRGTAKGNDQVRADVIASVLEAWRIAADGIIVKLTDANHGDELVLLSYDVIAALGLMPYAMIITYRETPIDQPRRKTDRVPDNNSAIYLAFRKDSQKAQDFDEAYERQAALLPLGTVTRLGRCSICHKRLPDGSRRDRTYCSRACLQEAYRRRCRRQLQATP